LDRVAQILAVGRTEPGARGLVNCEDEPYMGAALGCALGILRHPLWAPRAGEDYNPTQLDRRLDEVVRAVRWHRLAPAYGIGETSVTLDENILADSWLFKPGETWAGWVIGHEILQRAPARVARGMPLPEVRIDGQAPYVVAGRHPNGATSVATLPRTHAGLGIRTPLADVSIEIGAGPVGVFGRYRSLTLTLPEDLGERRVWAQDLAGDQSTDITALVAKDGRKLTLPGSLIDSVGLSAATPGDLSEPGMVMKLI